MNSLLLELVKAAKLPPAYVYVASSGRYRDAVTGRFVALKTVFALLNSNEAASLEKMQKLCHALVDSKLSAQAWYLAMQQQLRRLNVQNAALAAGGFDALKQRDLTRMDAALRDDLERLNRFGADIQAGRLSIAQINSRAAMYAGNARIQYYATLPKPATKPRQVVLERRVLGTAEHCAYCTYLASLGWQPYGTLPLPGESDPDWQDDQCFTNCHCDLERQVFSKVEAATLVKPLKTFFTFDYSHTNKGGEGSGFHNHHGRPGERGGSAPADTLAPAATEETARATFPVRVFGDVNALADFGLDSATLSRCMDIGLPNNCRAFIKAQRLADGGLSLTGQWLNESNLAIGTVIRNLDADHETVQLTELAFESDFIGKGFGKRAAEQWYQTLADAGYTTAKLEADMTIGRYAWAKEGAQYEDKSMPRWATDEFRKWAGRHDIQLDSDEWPRFTSPQDVANYKHLAYTLHGSDIENDDVPADLPLSLGKAFMLDKGRYGHDSWNAVIDLTQWKGRSSKAADMPADSKTSKVAYIEARGVPDATDGAFWAQYLTEEEGEQVFGFGEQFGKSFSIKGGPGSGNHDHEGIPGHQGGSMPQGMRHEGRMGEASGSAPSQAQHSHPGRVWAGKQHEGEATLNKLETGSIGEHAVIDALSQRYGVEFGTVNVNVNNAPFDVAGDSLAVEVKTGLATNSSSAHHWRATIGQPGKAETELLKQMSPDEKRAHNERKTQAILERKYGLLDKMSKEAGHPIKPMTVGLIMRGDGKAADIYTFEGFHLRLPWSKYATDEYYLGTYDVENKVMHWKDAPTKAMQFGKSFSHLSDAKPATDQPQSNLADRALAAALEEVDSDFEQAYQWWLEHVDSSAGTVKRGHIGGAVRIRRTEE